MKNLIVRFVREENGQDLIEYSLLAALISVGSIARDAARRHGDQRPCSRPSTTALSVQLRSCCPARSGAHELPSRRVSFARGAHIT